jgi:hypothetical protein
VLIEILNEFQRNRSILCADDIAQKLSFEPSTVEGMLEMLTRMGKLVEIGGQSACEICPDHTSCLLITPARKMYALPSK